MPEIFGSDAFSPKEIEEFYAIKSILEGYAARRACENLSDREIEKERGVVLEEWRLGRGAGILDPTGFGV